MISFSLLSLATLFQPSLTLTPSSQIQGLEFLFNSTNGTHWRWRPEALNGPKWTFSVPQPDPCNDKNKAWQGITCSSTPSVCRTQDCEIVALTLTSYDLAGSLPANFFSRVSSLTSLQISSSQNLTGSIPSDIGLLSQLSQISLDSNQLTGSIPSEICLLNKLKIFFAPSNGFTGTLPNELNSLSLLNLISLYSNRLTGSIPSQLGLLSQLNFLALYSNQFTGTVPSELGSLIRMNFLYLDSNQLNGTIPSALSSLSLLRELFLHSNQLSGSIPPELGSLSRLSYLYLYFNRLTGPIPPELGALSQLNYLSLNTNYLTGPIPSGLGLLSRLRQLYLYFNELTAPIPPELGSLSLLNQLFLYGNHLSGPLPPELISLTQLNSLSLYFNQISGTIPSGLSSLSLLSELYLHSNQLSGTIPSTLSALSQLISLSLNSNQLTGSIPSELSLLSRLNELDLFYNRLTGIIPPEFTLLSQLNSLTLAENDLTGPMPPELSSLLQLMVLFLDGNRLTGTIPSVISSLSLLRFFSLNFNRFSGAIPPELSSLSRLEFFELSFNQFSGTIPPELTRISQLKNLDLAFNQLTGTLSDELSLLSQLVNGYLHSNRFSGTIPSSLSLLSRLNFLSLNSNDFTGTIPSQLSSLSRLRYLYLYSNHLTGTIPPSFASSLLDLIYLLLSSNSLTGPIPSQIGLLTSLEELDLSQNSLTGSIPSSIVNLKNLIRLRFYQNILRGEISFSLASFPRLQQLFLHQNRFYGRLQQLFSPTSNHSLLNLDLSDNRFSGSVPSQLFLLPHLQSISLSLNCFEHKLPLSMCEAVGVGVISMSGLGASSSCQHVVTVPFTSVSLVQTMDGSIPDCVWLLSNVKILNLAGNGLRGTIGETSWMPFLLSLTLSHNYLRGTIPSWLQEKNMSQLDLSHNKLTGTLDGFKSQGEGIDFGLVNRSLGSRFLDQTLKLSVNRLSGDLSFSLKKYATLDILSGNLFGCARIPRNDKNSEWEVCGSEEYDQSLIVMGGVCGLIVLVTAFYGLCLLISSFTLPPVGGKAVDQQQAEDSKISTERSPSSSNSSLWFERRLLEHRAAAIRFVRYFYFTDLPSSPSIRSFGFLLSNLTRSVCLLTFLSLILSFPIYVLKVLDKESQDGGGSTEDEAQYITHSHMYRWLWTVAFVSGTVPSVLLLTVTFLCLMFFCVILTVLGVGHDSPRSVQELEMKDERDPERVDHFRDTSVAIPDEVPQLATPVGRDASFDGDPNEFLVSGVWVILLANIAVVGTVNGLYLWSTLLDLSNLMRILIQFSFGLFTFVWRVLILRGGLPTRLKESRYGVRLFTYLNIVNTVIIPCVVTALSDPSCYQRLLIPPDEIASSYSFKECSLFFIGREGQSTCLFYAPTLMDPLTITPPFSYSYQCGSSLLVSYIPVYMYSVSLQLLAIAIKLLVLTSSASSFVPDVWLMKWFAPITWPLPLTEKLKDDSSTPSIQLIKPHQILSNVVSNLILLLSFGLCSPVLGCYITLSVSVTLYCWLMMIGRFVSHRLDASPSRQISTPSMARRDLDVRLNPISVFGVEDKNRRDDGIPPDSLTQPLGSEETLRTRTGDGFLDLLNRQVRGVNSSLKVCQWPVIFTSCFFVTLLCWEMVGDEVGWEGGLWVPAVGVAMLLTLGIWDRLLVSGVIDLSILSSLLTVARTPLLSDGNFPSTELVCSSLPSLAKEVARY